MKRNLTGEEVVVIQNNTVQSNIKQTSGKRSSSTWKSISYQVMTDNRLSSAPSVNYSILSFTMDGTFFFLFLIAMRGRSNDCCNCIIIVDYKIHLSSTYCASALSAYLSVITFSDMIDLLSKHCCQQMAMKWTLVWISANYSRATIRWSHMKG